MQSFLPLFFVLATFGTAFCVRAAEPFLKPHDVIAFVGGEDMVAASEYGYLELLLVRALPDYHLRFRNLAWEGDTVFEQRRDLNFPPLEAQLDKIGATVVIAQFGQMESLAGKEKLPEFIAAYERLIERMSGGGKRRVVIQVPQEDDAGIVGIQAINLTLVAEQLKAARSSLAEYQSAMFNLADRSGLSQSHGSDSVLQTTRDGIHNCEASQAGEAANLAARLLGPAYPPNLFEDSMAKTSDAVMAAIRAKHRLWFNYWRPQNWAFLNGDRTSQPSSRDHLDPSKRWFPAEIEEFVPLIEAKEREIDALAAKLAKP